MNHAWIPLALAAALAAGCRSERTTAAEAPSAPVAARPAQPEPQEDAPKKAEAIPALPVIAQKSPAPAQPAAKPAPSAREAQVASIAKELEDASTAWFDALEKAMGDNPNPSSDDFQKANDKVRIEGKVHEPDTQGAVARVRALVEADPTDLGAFRGLQWLLDNATGPQSMPEWLALLEKHHLARPEMGELCRRLAQDGRALLEKLVAESPHRDVRGLACSALADSYKNDLQLRDYIVNSDPKDQEGMKGWLGAERLAALQVLDVEATNKRIASIYERVAREFADVKTNAGTPRESTLGAAAESELYEIHNLAVGMRAPEIEGVDLDGVAFRLSDYRGKVVLLDFWGNW